MDLKRDYEKLYRHWFKEFKQADLTDLNQGTFNDYIKIVNFITNYKEEEKDKLKTRVLESYKENFNFLFNDLLKMRKLKIINFAFSLQEINLNNVIEAEKLFFQNLISSIKGYEKIKAISIYDEEKILRPAIATEVNQDEILETKRLQKPLEKIEPLISQITSEMKEEKFNYIIVRFLRETPALVGIDLMNYGPFRKEDIASLPLKNAKILINEKFAEKVEIP